MPPEIAARIAAGQELRRRGRLSPEQDAALGELERRYSGQQAEAAAPEGAPPAQDPLTVAMMSGDTATARQLAEDFDRRRRPQPAQEPPVEAQGSPTARERGREEGRGWSSLGAAAQGAGSMMFGLGTPINAAAKMLTSAVPGGEPIMGPGTAMEYARGTREGAKEAHPVAYGAGALTGLVRGAGLVKAGAKAFPKASGVFALQEKQTLRNILRLSGAGAVAAGATAGLQEGADAVVPAAEAGAVLGPVAAGATAGALRAGAAGLRRIRPDNAALKLLADRVKEPVSVLTERYNALLAQFERAGITRKPTLMELTGRETASGLGIVASRSPAAGRVLTEAQEAATQRVQSELPAMIRSGGTTTTVPAQQARLAPLEEATRRGVGSRVRSTETAQLGRRDKVMDAAMSRIGNHRVPLSDDMLEVIQHPDVQSALSPALRRRINDTIEQGEQIGSIDLSVRSWEMARQALASKAGPGAGKIYSQLRNKLTEYVSDAVPEYGAALREFGRRSATAETTAAARAGVTRDAREFADMLRAAGEGTHGTSARAGARVGVRNWLADQLGGTPQQASRVMARIARDRRLRNNLREALGPQELRQLEEVSTLYGRQLNVVEGAQLGTRVLPKGDAAKFRDAVYNAQATPESVAGVRASARGALAGAAGESPGRAIGVAEAMSEYGGLQSRIATALGAPEAGRLRGVGEAVTRGVRGLETAAPRTTEAAARAAQQAEEVKNIIGAATVAGGHTGGAFKATFAFRVAQRLRIGEKAAKRMAEMAVDTKNADVLIRRLSRAGVPPVEMLRWYRDAAVAAGIVAGNTQ